jgi:hypothetical protein
VGLPNPLSGLSNPLSGLASGLSGLLDLPGRIADAINGWIKSLVAKAVLHPLLVAFGRMVLTTPDVSRLPEIHRLWVGSLGIAAALFLLVLIVAGLAVMGQDSVTTRAAAREYAPRVVSAWLFAAFSVEIVGVVIRFANALTLAFTDQKVSAGGATDLILTAITAAAADGSTLLLIAAVVVAVLITMLIVGSYMRAIILMLMIVTGPLMLIGQALPWTEGLASLWWRAVGACAAVQVGQSVLIVLGVQVLFSDDGGVDALFGGGPLVNILAALALLVTAVRLQGWVTQLVLRGTGGRSLVASYARARLLRAGIATAAALL